MLEFIPCSFTVKKLHYVLPGPAPKKTFQIYQSNAQARNLHRLPPATLQGRSPKSLQEIRETMENTRRKKLHHDEQRSLHWGGAREWVSQPVILLAIGRLEEKKRARCSRFVSCRVDARDGGPFLSKSGPKGTETCQKREAARGR